MSGDDLEEMLRAMARELGRSVERLDIDELADSVGVDPERAREWLSFAGGWLRAQTPPNDPSNQPAKPSLARVDPHPLDLPTEDQGVALAALDSGRWAIEPGTSVLAARGEGPGPSDALGLTLELRVRDWIDADGTVTLAGRRALTRWLEAS